MINDSKKILRRLKHVKDFKELKDIIKRRLIHLTYRIAKHDINNSQILTELNGIQIVFNNSSYREYLRAVQYSEESKEPEMFEWVDHFFKESDVFYDVGANTGGYSLYAAKKVTNLKVLCFEPSVQNILALNKNIVLNHLSENVKAFCIGLSDQDKISCFNMFDSNALFEAGFAANSLNSDSNRNGEQKSKISIGAISLCMDSMVFSFGFPFPNHIKIDVDGHENFVMGGAEKVLRDNRLQSIMIELEFANYELISLIESFGFKKYPLKKQMKTHLIPGMGNILFHRTE